MKLNRYLKWMLGATVALAGCADDDFINRDAIWDGVVPDELTLTLTIPDPEVVSLGGTRGEDGPINSLTVLQYKDGGIHITGKNIEFKSASENDGNAETLPEPNDDGTYTIKATLDKDCKSIHIVTNHTVDASTTDLSAVVVSEPRDISADTTAPILWGHADLSSLLSANASLKPEISLMRQTAKLILENNAGNFTVKEYGVYNMPTTGTVAPKLANFENGVLKKATVITEGASKTVYTDQYEGFAENKAIYMFESPASCDGADVKDATHITRRILIKGEYEGKDYWYVAAFRTRTPDNSTVSSDTPDAYEYETIDILRNHIYKLQIQEVRGIGWENKEDALKSLPDNRATIWLGDITPDITDMIATRDYMLGVSGAVECDWDDNATIKVVTSYPVENSAELKELLDVTVRDDEDKDWMHPEAIDYADTSMVSSDSSIDPVSGKTIRTLIVNIPLDRNSLTSDDREGWVVVRTGKLTREVKITQTGRPLRNDRETILLGLPGETVNNYFDWIENTVKGTSDEDNRITIGGMSRNEALIFAAVPAYTLSYKVKKNSGDTTPVLSGTTPGDFNVSDSGDGYWLVEAKNTSAPHISSAVMTITESTSDGNVATRYNLLQCGYFHKLTTDHLQYMSPTNRPATGWYYYEVVEKNGFYTLDRNIGASSNESYDRSSVNYTEDDERATGAYLKANAARPADRTNQMDNVTICDDLGMTYAGKGRFIIPSRAEMNYLGLRNNGRVNGNSVTVSGLVNGKRIYFPAAGYYYGSQYKNNLHVNLWTRSLLMGTQGLTEDDAEYGCSYEGVNILSGVVTFNAFRLANGSDGSLGNVWRYLPVRPVWRGDGETLTTPKLDDAELETEYNGPITLWVKQNCGWTSVNCYAWYTDPDNNNAVTQNNAFPGVAMTPNQTHNGENNWYKVTIDSKYTHLIFAQASKNQTANIEFYRDGNMQASEFEFVIASNKSYEMKALSGSTPTPDPSEDRTTVTILLQNDAMWQNANLQIFNITQVGSNYMMSKVTYRNLDYFRADISESDYIEALNSENGKISFIGTPRNGGANATTAKLTTISDNSSDCTFIFTNDGSGSLVSKQSSVLGQDATESDWYEYRIKGSLNGYGWDYFEEFDKLGKGKYEIATLKISSLGGNAWDNEFVIQRKKENAAWDKDTSDWGKTSGGKVDVTAGGTFKVRETSDNDQNWKFTEKHTYSLELDVSNPENMQLKVTKIID